MTTSATEWPSTAVPEDIKQVLARFFVLGDTPTAEAGWQMGEEVFCPNGQIIVNTKVISGTAELSNHWIPGLKARKHVVHKVYSRNNAGDDLMLFGDVTWTFSDDTSDSGGFAARALFETYEAGNPKLRLYQGWADLSALMAAMSRIHKDASR